MKRKIVWIDDDVDILTPVVLRLEEAGYEIESFHGVEEALESLDAIRHASLILLDLILPSDDKEAPRGRETGLDLLKKLREMHQVSTPVIVLSVAAEAASHDLSLLGVDRLLRKPVLPSQLHEAVDSLIGTP